MSDILRSSTKLLVGIIIFLGLPLLGWGLGNVAGFFSHPARLAYAIAVVVLQLFVVLRLPETGAQRSPEPVTPWQRLALLPLQLLPLAIVIVAPYSDRRAIAVLGDGLVIRYLGLLLFVLGFMLMQLAEAALARQFSVYVTIQFDHHLVTDGLYRYVRHPRYLGIIVFVAGVALLFRSWLALGLVAALAMVLLWRIQGEEALLEQTFGPEWHDYSRNSWRLIPFLY